MLHDAFQTWLHICGWSLVAAEIGLMTRWLFKFLTPKKETKQ